MHFGLNGQDAMHLQDIGIRLGITQQCIQMNKNKTIATLRGSVKLQMACNNYLA